MMIKSSSYSGVSNLPAPCSDWNITPETRSKLINYTLNVKTSWKILWGDAACLSSNNYYFGRGAIQLSYPYNYKAFGQSDFIKAKGYDLVANPDL